MLTLSLLAASLLAPQDPTAPSGVSPRIAVQADGSAVTLSHDGTPPTPLFGGLFPEAGEGSLLDALANCGVLGNIGVFLGSPRPLATLLDPAHYCEQAGIKRSPAALRELLAPAAGASAAQQRRRAFDRLVALTLLAPEADPASREVLAKATASEDRFIAAWAGQLHGAKAPMPSLQDHIATVLTHAPAATQLVMVVEHAHMPRWHDLWRIAGEVGRAVARREVELMEMEPDEARAALAEAELVIARTGLLAFEFARRFGNALITRTVVAAPSALTVGPSSPWLHFEGLFEPERVAEGLRTEGFEVTVYGSVTEAATKTDVRLRATPTSLAIDATAAKEHVGPDRAKAIATTFDVPHLALGVALLGDDAIGANVPDEIEPLVTSLRAILLRHDGSDGAHLWLDLHYADAKPATVAATAAGGLLTAATGMAGQAPQAIRDLLREIKVTRKAAVVTVEVELDDSLALWVEKLAPQLVR